VSADIKGAAAKPVNLVLQQHRSFYKEKARTQVVQSLGQSAVAPSFFTLN
jgi:hypothetical protein